MLTQQMLTGGILLLYLNALGIKTPIILLVLNLTPFLSSLLSIPVAWGSDYIGIKRFGNWGNSLMIAGMACIAGSAFLHDVEPRLVLPVVLLGLVLHLIGASFFNTGWFSLLSHIVPVTMTGRYFGLVRFSWQLMTLLFFALSAMFFSSRTPLWIYQAVLAAGALSVGCRFIFYKAIPDAPVTGKTPLNMVGSVQSALALPGFTRYLVYLLLLVCVTGNGQDVLRLSAVGGCGMGDNQILYLSVANMAGALAAFRFMGRIIDHLGSRRMFQLCHIGFAIALLLFPVRAMLHLPPLAAGIVASVVLGIVSSTLGLTTTSHSFRVCHGAQRTIAYALVSATQSMGSGLSGFALAALLARFGASVPGGNPFDVIMVWMGAFILVQMAALRLLNNPAESIKGVCAATGP
jgi:MFS family permease